MFPVDLGFAGKSITFWGHNCLVVSSRLRWVRQLDLSRSFIVLGVQSNSEHSAFMRPGLQTDQYIINLSVKLLSS